jgi:hypothetical protein
MVQSFYVPKVVGHRLTERHKIFDFTSLGRSLMGFVRMAASFRHILTAVLLFSVLAPATLFACTQENAERLVANNLGMRLRFLENEERKHIYNAAAAEKKAQALESVRQNNWPALCREVFGLIAIADDVLAEGDGKTEPLKTPWGRCSPERMLTLMDEYDTICQPSGTTYIRGCAKRELAPLRREMVHLKSQAGKGDLKAARYVLRMCELYTQMLNIIRK